MPLQYQKNMRECELLCQESVLKVIRSGIPVEKIIRSYIDETTDEEIVHEVTEKEVEKEVEDVPPPEKEPENEEPEQIVADKISLTKEEPVETLDNNAIEDNSKDMKENVVNDVKEELKEVIEKVISDTIEENSSDKTSSENNTSESKQNNTVINVDTTPLDNTNAKLTFNNTDSVLDMGTNKESNVDAPKTIERLEEIHRVNEAKRKAEEAEYDDDEDDDYNDSLKIMDNDNVDLGLLDIHDLKVFFCIILYSVYHH